MLLALGVLGFIAIDLLVVWTILRLVFGGLWKPFSQAFPSRAVVEPSITKRFQSFSMNSMNLGGCIHVTLDDVCLHLKPVRILRWLGLDDASIPWESIEIVGNAPPKEEKQAVGGYVKTRMGKFHVRCPAWCLAMIRDR